jgi:hypothetical protein
VYLWCGDSEESDGDGDCGGVAEDEGEEIASFVPYHFSLVETLSEVTHVGVPG